MTRMRKLILFFGSMLVGLVLGVGALALSSTASGPVAPSTAGESACKAAMRAQYRSALRGDPTPSVEPAACVGLDPGTLQRLAGEIMAEERG